MIRQYFVFNTPQYREYDQRDRPVYGEIGHGPWCSGLPNPPVPIGPHPLDNGTDMDENPPHEHAPGHRSPPAPPRAAGSPARPGDQAIINAMLAGRTGRPADSYGSLGSLDVRPRGPRAGGRLMSRNSTTIAAAVKLGIFTVSSLLVTGLLAAIMGNIGFGGGKEYKAVFTTASMLQKGDDVRIAGVNVGEVREVEHYERTQALVTFRIKDEIELTTASRAEIRFLNLVGDRYLALEQGARQRRRAARGRRHHPGRAAPAPRST